MENLKILVGRKNGNIETHVIRLRKNGSISSAICAYGTALQQICHDVDGITHTRGYCWVGHHGTGRTLTAYTNFGEPKIAGWDTPLMYPIGIRQSRNISKRYA